MTLLLLIACSDDLAPPAAPGPAELHARLDKRKVGAGEPATLVVEAELDEGWTGEPTFSLPADLSAGTPQVEELDLGARVRRTWTVELRGPEGSYVIEAPTLEASSGGQVLPLSASPLYLDIGVNGPSSKLAGPVPAPPAPAARWPWVVGAALALTAVGGGAWLWWSRRPKPPPPPPPGPDEVALAEWAKARASGLDDHSLALALSAIVRRYVEAVTGAPATSMTGFELVADLEGRRAFKPHIARCKRLLTATDLIKFAREKGSAQLFEELDQDLRTVVLATRPPKPLAGVPRA